MVESGSSGAEICRGTSLPSGTVYPILSRLEECGWLRSQWEAGDPAALGRPRKRFYTVTAAGAAQAKATAERFAGFAARLAI
jgi:DNA-binding PadR family transcriptional regulator